MSKSLPSASVHRLFTGLALFILLHGLSGCTSWFETKDNRDPPKPLQELKNPLPVTNFWSIQVGSSSNLPGTVLHPALDDGRLFVANADGTVAAVDASSGQQIWSIQLDQAIIGGVGAGHGLAVVSTAEGDLVALDSANGNTQWRKPLNAEILAPAAITASRVIVRSADGVVRGLDHDGGDERWRFKRSVPALSLRGTSRPTVSGDLVINGSDNGRVTVLKAINGVALWERRIAAPRGRSELDRLIDLDPTPVVRGNTLFLSGIHGRIAALDLSSGRVRWASKFSTYRGIDVGSRRLLAVDEQSDLHCFDLRNGNHLWKQDDLHARSATAPQILGGHALVADFQGWVHFVNLESGLIEARIQVDSNGVTAEPLTDLAAAYVQGVSGKLSAIALK